MITMKKDYTWMSTESIIEELSNEELRTLYCEILLIINAEVPIRIERSEVLEQIRKNEEPRHPHLMEVINFIDNLLRTEILFRFKEKKAS